MRIFKYFPKGDLFLAAEIQGSNLNKLISVFDDLSEELHDMIKDLYESFIPSKGFYFIDSWMNWLNANVFGYFPTRSHAEKVRNLFARFKLSKTNTFVGIVNYLKAVGYDVELVPNLATYGFPLEFPYSFATGIPAVDKIVITSGSNFSNTYPNGYFATLEEAKQSLIVFFPPATTASFVQQFGACLEEILCVQTRVVYEITSP